MLCFFVFQKEGGTEKMKITIQNGELEQKVGIALKGVNGRNSTKPILKCIKRMKSCWKLPTWRLDYG